MTLGMPIEQLPIRYLGLPLTARSMKSTEYEPLLDRIRSRFTAWSNKVLSFAGRLQLIQSVIVSTINFWLSAFHLPKRCLKKIESLCSAFLWSGNPNTGTKAKVAWQDITTPKAEGGLGIRKLKDASNLFTLKLIWRLMSNRESLWAKWTNVHLLGKNSFWDISLKTTKGSWMWKKLLKLRPMAIQLIKTTIGDGFSTHFWFDNWLDSGPLINVLGTAGPRILGIPRGDKVAHAVRGNRWKQWRVRGPLYTDIVTKIQAHPIPNRSAGNDNVMWKQKENTYENKFLSKWTWNLIRRILPEVEWHKLVWFRHALPHQSFIMWIVMRDRLPTGNRMRNWGLTQHCPLCGEVDETREHLFFACPFSFTVWMKIASNLLGTRISPDWNLTVQSLLRNRLQKTDKKLVIMAFQSTIYWLWRERNRRIHTTASNSVQFVTTTIQKEIHMRIHEVESIEEDIKNRWNYIVSLTT